MRWSISQALDGIANLKNNFRKKKRFFRSGYFPTVPVILKDTGKTKGAFKKAPPVKNQDHKYFRT